MSDHDENASPPPSVKREGNATPAGDRAGTSGVRERIAHSGTQLKILSAAMLEFAERGLRGARIENIAKRAKLNKALIYRHFKSKEGLFSSALREKFEDRYGLFERTPQALGDALEYWFRHASDDPIFMRLLQRESLNPEQPVVHAELRQLYYSEQAADLSKRADEGQLPPDMNPRMLLVALTALVTFPAYFPRIAKLISGFDPSGESFKSEWSTFLRQLAEVLSATEPTPSATENPRAASDQK